LGVILFKQGTQVEFLRFTAVAQKSSHGEISSAADQLARVARYKSVPKRYQRLTGGVPFSLCNTHATWYFVFPMLLRTRLPSSGFIEP
jgi:hypothetical protein